MFKTPLPQQLSPTWKVMLLSDGSVTRHLQLLTGQSIAVVRACPRCWAPPTGRSIYHPCRLQHAVQPACTTRARGGCLQ